MDTDTGKMPMLVEIVSFAPGHCFATWKHFVLVLWRRPPTLDAVEELTALLERRALDAPSGVYVLAWIEGRAARAPVDARAAFVRAMKALETTVRGYAFVFEGRGLGTAAARGALGAILRLAGLHHVTKTFGSTPEAAAWLASLSTTEPRVPAKDIVAAGHALGVAMADRATRR